MNAFVAVFVKWGYVEAKLPLLSVLPRGVLRVKVAKSRIASGAYYLRGVAISCKQGGSSSQITNATHQGGILRLFNFLSC